MLGLIIGTVVIGLIIGLLGRLIVPGRNPMGILGTVVLGIAGSFIGGFVGRAIFHDQRWHFVLAVLAAAALVLLMRRAGGGRRAYW